MVVAHENRTQECLEHYKNIKVIIKGYKAFPGGCSKLILNFKMKLGLSWATLRLEATH